MRATVSGESPLRGLGFAASAAFCAACSPLDAELVGALDALQHEGEPRKFLRRDRLPGLAEMPHGGEHHRPQALDEHQRQLALRALAELLHPHLEHAVGLLLPVHEVAHVLGVASDGRARAVFALCPDAGCDLVDCGAVGDGPVDGLAQVCRQLGDGGAPEGRVWSRCWEFSSCMGRVCSRDVSLLIPPCPTSTV